MLTCSTAVINGFFISTEDEKAFLMPTYNTRYAEETDAARDAMAAAMPGVTIIDVPTDSLIAWGGAIHCVTKTIPVQAWPDPCNDPYDFNDDDCVVIDTGSSDTGTAADKRSKKEEEAGCGCATSSHGAYWLFLIALVFPWTRRRC